ncbi:MAG: S-layer y protein [Bacillota bacterium]|nr:S-layer y protein [Bacillota bacterium]
MKIKLLRKILSLTLVFTIVLTSVASALTFTDISKHWAKDYIERVADYGIVQGYSNGTFKPDGNVTVLESLVMMSRLYKLDDDVKSQIIEQYKPILEGMDNTKYREWSFEYLSIIMALNVVSENGIRSMFEKNANGVIPITQPASKEEIAILLTKAMMLGDEAKNLKVYTLPFNDASLISTSARPYIYLMYENGILLGDTKKNINPKDNISRAVISTMLDRTYTYINNNDVKPDLSAYEQLTEIKGTVTQISLGSAESSIYVNTGASTSIIKVNENSKIYLNNELADISNIKLNMLITCYVNDERLAKKIELDSLTKTINGKISNVAFTPPAKITITDENGYNKTYDVSNNASIYLNGKTTELKNLLKDDLITALVKDGVISEIKSTSKTQVYNGEITNIDYLSYPVKITIKTDAGNSMTFEYSSSVIITRNLQESSFDQVRAGDDVILTAEYGKMIKLNFVAKEAELSGVIKEILIAPKSKIKIEDVDGYVKEYLVSSNVNINIGENVATIYDLRLGYKVNINTFGDEIVTLHAEEIQTVNNLNGKVIYINLDENLIMMQNIKSNGQKELVYLTVTNATKIFNTSGETKYMKDITEGKNIICTSLSESGKNVAVSILIQ